MCEACPTKQDRVKAVGREVLADLLIPVIIFGIVVAALMLGGAITVS